MIGADGLHSNVRGLTFGPESRSVSFLGYYLAGWDVPNHLDLGPESLMYNLPGKLASVGGNHRDPTRASTLFVFASPRSGLRPPRPQAAEEAAGRRLRRDRLGGPDPARGALGRTGAVLRLDQPGGPAALVQRPGDPGRGRRRRRDAGRDGHRHRGRRRLRPGRRARRRRRRPPHRVPPVRGGGARLRPRPARRAATGPGGSWHPAAGWA